MQYKITCQVNEDSTLGFVVQQEKPKMSWEKTVEAKDTKNIPAFAFFGLYQ
jgi:hypothetical protein